MSNFKNRNFRDYSSVGGAVIWQTYLFSRHRLSKRRSRSRSDFEHDCPPECRPTTRTDHETPSKENSAKKKTTSQVIRVYSADPIALCSGETQGRHGGECGMMMLDDGIFLKTCISSCTNKFSKAGWFAQPVVINSG